jgi:dihydroorotate dehydrogenase electron transfer subunit
VTATPHRHPDGMPTPTARAGDAVVHAVSPVVESTAVGEYHRLTLAVPGVAALATPGQFTALAVGGATSGLLLRRAFSIHRTRVGATPAADLMEIVVADAGPGTRWLTERRAGDVVDVVAPLGKGFPMPARPGGAAILVGGGYGSAPLFWMAQTLRSAGVAAHLVLGAATRNRLYGTEFGDSADSLQVTTDDGSAGVAGQVTLVLPALLADTNATTVYACGPMGMLRAVTDLARGRGITAYVAVEEAMACGVGVCMTCVLPVVGDDGATSMRRACVDGPVLDGARLRWSSIADGRVSVPDDAVGAPRPAGGAR